MAWVALAYTAYASSQSIITHDVVRAPSQRANLHLLAARQIYGSQGTSSNNAEQALAPVSPVQTTAGTGAVRTIRGGGFGAPTFAMPKMAGPLLLACSTATRLPELKRAA